MKTSCQPFAALLLLGLIGCASEPDPEVSQPRSSVSPELTYNNIQLTEAKPDGRILWKVIASRAKYNQKRTAASLEGVQAEFYDPQNNAIRTTALTGSAFPLEKRLEMQGSVNVSSSLYQLQLQADRVEWLPEKQLLSATGHVKVAHTPTEPSPAPKSSPSPGIQLTDSLTAVGDRLTINFATQQLQLKNDSPKLVQANSTRPPLQLQAREINWNIKTQRMTAAGSVSVVQPVQRIRLTGDQLAFQLPVRELILTGQAYARSEVNQLEVQADQMSWIVNSPVVKAKGQVRYQQPGQNLSVTGNAAVLNWQSQVAQVKGQSTTTVLNLPK